MINKNIIVSRIMGIGEVQRQSIVSLIWQITFTFIGFLSTMYFAHSVGASVLGAYFLFVAYYGIIGIVSNGGLAGAAIKRISEGEEQDAYFSTYFVLRSIFVTVIVLALIISRRYFVDLSETGIFTWLILALIISIFQGSINCGVGGCGKMGIRATGDFINNISRVLVQVVAIFLGYGVAGLTGGFVAGMLIGALFELRFLNLHLVRFGWRHIKSLLTFSFWTFLISSGMLIFMYADTIMIGYYLSNADVGVYRVIFQFTGIAAFTTNALRGILYPKISRWGKNDEIELIEKSLSRAFTYSLILAVPLFAGGIFFGNRLLYFFYGAEFAQNYTTLMMLFIVQIILIFKHFFTIYLTALEQLKDLFKITIVTVAGNIILNAILIPLIGISGAAVATLVSITLYSVLSQRVLSQMIKIRIERDSLLNILKASAIMSLFVGSYCLFVPLSNVWLALVPVVLGVGIYSILILKFDRKIYEEFRVIMAQMNVAWPDW